MAASTNICDNSVAAGARGALARRKSDNRHRDYQRSRRMWRHGRSVTKNGASWRDNNVTAAAQHLRKPAHRRLRRRQRKMTARDAHRRIGGDAYSALRQRLLARGLGQQTCGAQGLLHGAGAVALTMAPGAVTPGIAQRVVTQRRKRTGFFMRETGFCHRLHAIMA